MGTLKIDALGTSFTVKSNEESAYLAKLFDYFKRLSSQIQKSNSTKDSLQTAILTAIAMCDELYKEKYKNAKLKGEVQNLLTDEDVNDIAEKLIKKLDTVL